LIELSPDHKFGESADATLGRLLDLDGQFIDMRNGYWVKIDARQVAATEARPHGIVYSLCLLGPTWERLVCFDNAHPVSLGTDPARKRTETNDHMHEGKRIKPYDYTNAGQLLDDFWELVFNVLKDTGAP
jgi:hypothetical protein